MNMDMKMKTTIDLANIRSEGGSLTFTGNYTAVGSPSGMVFLI